MLIHKTYKYRLYPTPEQQAFLARQFGCCRYVYNYFLRARMDYYEAHKDDPEKKGLTYADTSAQLTALKRQPETVWLREVNAQSLQQSLRDLDTAYKNFFEGRTGYPEFKGKRARQSFRVPQNFRLEGEYLRIAKMAPIKIVLHRPLEGPMSRVTIVRTGTNKYYAAILCEVGTPDTLALAKATQPEIGVDLGLKHFAVLSTGEKIAPPGTSATRRSG